MESFSKIIAVFGSSAITQDSPEAARAHRLGRLLAEASFTVCNGGYMGVMEACSRGASEAGGKVIGVTCETFSRRSPNPFLTEEIPCKDLLERIATLMRIADAYLVLDGNIGTLAELFSRMESDRDGMAKIADRHRRTDAKGIKSVAGIHRNPRETTHPFAICRG
ncbi:MAG: hypothetical protein C4527_20810 [Candidatus Omnitrophota bacterium]|nr:MAG: hypothetical protein C4527_20810 [Candidatus Omnitrophota bacterium]